MEEDGKTEQDDIDSIIDEEEDAAEELTSKYGFKQSVVLDMQLPGNEREIIHEY